MNVGNLQRISAVSESAGLAVLQRPKDPRARTRLLVALSDLIDPAFQGEEATDYHSTQLIPEVRVWAQIVHTRIELARNSTSPRSTLRIRHPAQQLLQALNDLLRECWRIDQATNVVRGAQADLRSPSVKGSPYRMTECWACRGFHYLDTRTGKVKSEDRS